MKKTLRWQTLLECLKDWQLRILGYPFSANLAPIGPSFIVSQADNQSILKSVWELALSGDLEIVEWTSGKQELGFFFASSLIIHWVDEKALDISTPAYLGIPLVCSNASTNPALVANCKGMGPFTFPIQEERIEDEGVDKGKSHEEISNDTENQVDDIEMEEVVDFTKKDNRKTVAFRKSHQFPSASKGLLPSSTVVNPFLEPKKIIIAPVRGEVGKSFEEVSSSPTVGPKVKKAVPSNVFFDNLAGHLKGPALTPKPRFVVEPPLLNYKPHQPVSYSKATSSPFGLKDTTSTVAKGGSSNRRSSLRLSTTAGPSTFSGSYKEDERKGKRSRFE